MQQKNPIDIETQTSAKRIVTISVVTERV